MRAQVILLLLSCCNSIINRSIHLIQVRSFSSRTINAAGLGQGKGRVPMKKKEIIVLAKK